LAYNKVTFMPIRKLLWLIAAITLCLPAFANQGTLRDGHPERYIVQKGDTLWDISQRFLRSPWLWPEIWYLNPDIANPHLIYPGDIISLVYIDGESRLTVQAQDRVGKTVKLSPRIREQPIESAIPTIPLEAIRPFLTETRIVEDGVLDRAPYVVAGTDQRVMSTASDKIYVRGLGTRPLEHYVVVRKGDVFVDPETEQVLGREARHIGGATTLRGGDPATLRVLGSNREILVGDRVLPPADGNFQGNFFPKAPDVEVDGRIIAVLDGVSQIGQFNIVAINRGNKHDLEVGDVLAVYKTGEVVRDTVGGKRGERVKLPDERAGELIVFRTFDGMSLGLVMQATRAMHVLDAVRNP
jgi:hypothetical protein